MKANRHWLVDGDLFARRNFNYQRTEISVELFASFINSLTIFSFFYLSAFSDTLFPLSLFIFSKALAYRILSAVVATPKRRQPSVDKLLRLPSWRRDQSAPLFSLLSCFCHFLSSQRFTPNLKGSKTLNERISADLCCILLLYHTHTRLRPPGSIYPLIFHGTHFSAQIFTLLTLSRNTRDAGEWDFLDFLDFLGVHPNTNKRARALVHKHHTTPSRRGVFSNERKCAVWRPTLSYNNIDCRWLKVATNRTNWLLLLLLGFW